MHFRDLWVSFFLKIGFSLHHLAHVFGYRRGFGHTNREGQCVLVSFGPLFVVVPAGTVLSMYLYSYACPVASSKSPLLFPFECVGGTGTTTTGVEAVPIVARVVFGGGASVVALCCLGAGNGRKNFVMVMGDSVWFRLPPYNSCAEGEGVRPRQLTRSPR